MSKLNLNLFKYGAFIHVIFFIMLLVYIDIGPKTPIFWAFLLNQIVFTYFVCVRAIAFGISKTLMIFNLLNEEKSIINDINKNN